MIVYEGICRDFIKQSLNPSGNRIEDEIKERMQIHGKNPSESEYRAWMNSLPVVAKVLEKAEIPDDAEVGVEFSIKFDGHRIDVIVCGLDGDGKESAVIIELKQWSEAYRTSKIHYVHTTGGNGEDDYWHPSHQAINYAHLIRNYYAYVQETPVIIRACSFLHNMPMVNMELLGDEVLYPAVRESPVYLKGDEERLGRFIKQFIKKPSQNVLFRIDHSTLRPSPKLSDMLRGAIEGKEFFGYSDEQADAVSTIVSYARDSAKYGEKRTIIIRGRPGTGKSIVAINAMGNLIAPKDGSKSLLAAYFTCNSAPRLLFTKKLTEDDYRKKSIDALFRHPLSLKESAQDELPCALFDEAHRMYDWKGGTGLKKGINLIERCIKASKVSVFFLDEDQAVTVHDYLTQDRLRDIAERCGSRVIDGPTLRTQFRVLGGDSYIQFIRCILGYGDTFPLSSPDGYDFRVFDSACEMREALREKNMELGDSRMVAGYTYEWITKKDRDIGYDIILDDGEFKAKWNMSKNDYSWLYDIDSFEDVGCIHTCQGLDMQYCGVIIGKDVRFENGRIVFDQSQIAKSDLSSGIRTCKDPEMAIRLIRNTYNVMLTRGMRGTFVYCEDEGLRVYLTDAWKRISHHVINQT